jgi:hypothetical protein
MRQLLVLVALALAAASAQAQIEILELNEDVGINYEDYKPRPYSLENTYIDASNARWKLQNSKNDNPTGRENCNRGDNTIQKYSVNLTPQPGAIWSGGLIEGEVPQESEWKPTYCNSARCCFG